MKAMVMTDFGGPEVFELRDVPDPIVEANDLLIEVKASAVNPVDCKTRTAPRWGDRRPPMILGFDVAGIVRAIGPDVEGFGVGDEVFASPSLVRDGSNAEFVCVDARQAAHRPSSLSMEASAVIPLAGLTAWESLHTHARISSRDTILIHAGAGGVGHLAIQIAKCTGATVIATAGNPDSIATAQKCGADYVFDYRSAPISQQVADLTGGRGCDIVLDTVGGDVFTDSLASAAQYGRVVTIVPGVPTDAINTLFARNVSLHFEFMGMPGMSGIGLEKQAHILRSLSRQANAGLIHPIVSAILPLSELPEAHRLQETGRTIGKRILVP